LIATPYISFQRFIFGSLLKVGGSLTYEANQMIS